MPKNPSPQANPAPDLLEEPQVASPMGFAPVDPMSPPPDQGSSPTPRPDLTTPPARPETGPASGGRAFGSGSPASVPASPKTTREKSSPVSFDSPGMRKLFREAVSTLGNAANARLPKESRDAGVWVADEADKENIGDPLGAIATRRLGLLNLRNVEDAEDLLKLLPALGAYVFTHVNKLIDLARARRARALPASVGRRVDNVPVNGGADQ